MGVLIALEAGLPAGTFWASRGVVDTAARAFGVIGPAAVGLIAARQLLGPLFQAARESASDRLTAHVNGALIAAANRWRGLARFEDPAFADHLAVARDRAADSPVQLLAYGGRFAQSLFAVVVMGAVLWRLHPLVPVLLVAAHLPQVLQENHFAQMMANTIQVHSPEGRKLTSYREAVLGAGAAKDVRLFDLGGFFGGLYAGVFGRLRAA